MIQWIMTDVNRVCCPWIIVANCSSRQGLLHPPASPTTSPDERNGCLLSNRAVDNGSLLQILTATNIGWTAIKTSGWLNLSRSRKGGGGWFFPDVHAAPASSRRRLFRAYWKLSRGWTRLSRRRFEAARIRAGSSRGGNEAEPRRGWNE